MIERKLFVTTALAVPLALAPLTADAADIVETLQNSDQFSQLADAIDKAGLAETLQGDGPYTIFAPTNQAFQNLSQQGEQSQAQAATGQSQTQGQGGQSGQQQAGTSQDQPFAQLDSGQLKQILSHHVVEGQELGAQDLLGKTQKVTTLSGDELTVDGSGTMLVLVPTGLTITRVGDDIFVRREVAAAAAPAVTVSPAGSQQGQQQASQAQSGQQQSQGGQQQAAASSGSSQQDQQRSGSGQQGQEQASQAQSGQQGQEQASQAQSGQQGQQQAGARGSGQGEGDQPIQQQQGMLRAAMVVEPGIQADNGVIHGIDQVLVPQNIEQQMAQAEGHQGQQQGQKTTQ